MATWILTGSPENYAATARARLPPDRDEGAAPAARRSRWSPGDRIVLYLTKVKAFAAAIRLTGELFEDRDAGVARQARHGRPVSRGASSPSPSSCWSEAAWLPAEAVKDDLEHIRKWPAEHWTLAFQGQLRTISEHDAGRPARRRCVRAPAAGVGR